MEMKQKAGNVPDIYVVVLPEGATDLYQQVKQYVLFMFLPHIHYLLTICFSASLIARWVLRRNVSRPRSASVRSRSTMQMSCSSSYSPHFFPQLSLIVLQGQCEARRRQRRSGSPFRPHSLGSPEPCHHHRCRCYPPRAWCRQQAELHIHGRQHRPDVQPVHRHLKGPKKQTGDY